MIESLAPSEYMENEQLEELWNDAKVYLLPYVNEGKKEPFTEEALYAGLLLVAKHILNNADRSLWTIACHADNLNRFTRSFLLRSSTIDPKQIGMQNLSKSLEYVRSNEYHDLQEAVSDIIGDAVDPVDLEKVLYEMLSSYKNQFTMVYQVLFYDL